MASLGDISRSASFSCPFGGAGTSAAHGAHASTPMRRKGSAGVGTWAQQPTSVDVHITDGSFNDTLAIFSYPSGFMGLAKVLVGGAHFYDYDDGTYTVTSTTSEQAWRVQITNAVVTVTPLFPPTGGGQTEPMYGAVS